MALLPVAGALTQVVQVSHRDRRQALVAVVAEDVVGPFHEFLGRQAG